ncbi:hypothetical protein [Rubritalea tangerina]|uniref:hypothetical protein n=1 Tax=Rubritalea tangerina TaxID=430798 RepID=UPI003613EFF3
MAPQTENPNPNIQTLPPDSGRKLATTNHAQSSSASSACTNQSHDHRTNDTHRIATLKYACSLDK